MTKLLNMKLWTEVAETNPADTKEVNFGRKITAINPYSQIKRATEQFGPAGVGWGWSVTETQHLPINEVAVLVRLWHGAPECYIEQWGQAGLYIDKKEEKKDGDCMKKATTDGLTKCLSYLGFNADVFAGKFDDCKYVQALNDKYADGAEWTGPIKKSKLKETLRTLGADVKACTDADQLDVLLDSQKDAIEQAKMDLADWFFGNKDSNGLEGIINEKRSEIEAV